MATPSLSIIIPTHKRAEILRSCLEHLAKQTIAEQLQVIVVSDGHDAQTAGLFDDIRSGKISFSLPAIDFFEIEKSQQGVARNRGVEKASAPMVLYIGDDIFLTPDACHKHLIAHERIAEKRQGPSAVLGFTTWDTALDITPAMRWLEDTGWQFGYTMLVPYRHDFVPARMQHRFTYTSNISLPTSVAQAHPFAQDVTLYGWEDIQWGAHLRDAGVKLYYEPDAAAFHHQRMTMENSLARIETLGNSLMHITKIAPELDRMPSKLKLVAYKLISLLPTMRGRHYKAFLKGLQKGG